MYHLSLTLHYNLFLHSPGLRPFNSAYERCLSLHREATLGMSTLLDSVLTWIISADVHPDTPPGGFGLKELDGLSRACEKGRDSVREALAARTGDLDERLLYRSAPIVAPRPQRSVRRLMGQLVRSLGSFITSHKWLV